MSAGMEISERKKKRRTLGKLFKSHLNLSASVNVSMMYSTQKIPSFEEKIKIVISYKNLRYEDCMPTISGSKCLDIDC